MSNVRTTNRSESILLSRPIKVSFLFDVPIPPATTEYIYVYPAQGRSAKVVAMDVSAAAPAGASVGSHTFGFDDGSTLRYLKGRSLFGSPISFDWGHWVTANDLKSPPLSTDQILAVSLIRFSSTQPFRLVYTNSTDVNQVTAPIVGLMYMELIE